MISISDLLDFLKKENVFRKLKEKEDQEYSSFLNLIESLIKILPDLSKNSLILRKF
jgi:hypothetical protein